MILREFFKSNLPTIEEIDCWVVEQIEPFNDADVTEEYYCNELEVDFGGCYITPSSLSRVFFHTIRTGIKIKCVNYTDTQKSMINNVYKGMKRALSHGYPNPPCNVEVASGK